MTSGKLQRLMQVCAVASLATLAACASPFQARVESFQVMPPAQGQSFYLAPVDSARANSLEFSSYASLVAAELQKHGYRQASAADGADLKVLVDFGSGPARERLATRPSTYPAGWGWGWAGRGWGGWSRYPGWYDPFYGPWGYWDNQEVYSYTIYPAFLHVMIQRSADSQPLFEGRAETTSRVNDMPNTMPKLVTALFTDFPGQSAVSKVVRVPESR